MSGTRDGRRRRELNGERVVREERLVRDAIGQVRDVRSGPDGCPHLLSAASKGALARLEPVAP